jgi:MoaA/NifB/PqqE/SkfB family radical SAM enzyme
MITFRSIAGTERFLFLQLMKIRILLYYLPMLLHGRMSAQRFITFLKRLLIFLAKLNHNKFVRFNGKTRLDLYVPGFPSPAFFTACDKFSVFGQKLPCVTTLISVTSACRYNCPHCYQKRDQGKDVAIDLLVSAVRFLQDAGIAFFNIEGGEPFLVYDRLKQVCATIDHRSEIWVNSTGDGMSIERLKELKALNLTAIMFSLHTADPQTLNRFMGTDNAWENLERGITLCHQADIPVTFNTCVPKLDFFNGAFDRIMEKAREFNGCLVQLIKPKPAGGRMEQGVERYTPEEHTRIATIVNRYNHDLSYRSFPAIAAQFLEETPDVFGCTAGGTDRFYINAKGDVQPCEFLNISFGNIAEEPFPDIYQHMRDCFDKPGETWLCEAYAQKIRELAGEESILPLDKEKSRRVYGTWDRGKETELYQKVEG